MRKIFLIAILLCLLLMLWANSYIQEEIEKCQVEIRYMQQEVEQLKLEQQELTQELREFLSRWNVVVMEASAYAPYDNQSGICADHTPSLTATGAPPGPGTIAVNNKVIPYHSTMWVQGYGWGEALDTGGMIRARDDLIDVYQDSYIDAMKWGRRKVVVVWAKQL